MIGCWRHGHITGLRYGGLTAEDALALERPAMTLARAWLRDRLARQVGRAYRAVAAPDQRTPAGRPVPVTRLSAVSAAEAAVRTPAAVPQRHRTADTAAVSGSAATRAPPAGRGVRGGPRPAATGLRRTRSPRSSTPAAAAHFVPPTRPRWPTGTGQRRRRTPAVRTRGQRTRLANTGSPQAPDAADTRHCGRGHADTAAAAPLDSRQRNRPPPHAYPAGTAAALDLHSARERWRSGEGAPERRLALSGWLSYFPMKKSCSGC